MMNTLQSGGIPGIVVGGVPMVGSHAVADMSASIAGWFAGGGRLRLPIGNTIVLRNGRPWLSLGTPGNVHITIPQVLSNILDHGMTPPEAVDAPAHDADPQRLRSGGGEPASRVRRGRGHEARSAGRPARGRTTGTWVRFS